MEPIEHGTKSVLMKQFCTHRRTFVQFNVTAGYLKFIPSLYVCGKFQSVSLQRLAMWDIQAANTGLKSDGALAGCRGVQTRRHACDFSALRSGKGQTNAVPHHNSSPSFTNMIVMIECACSTLRLLQAKTFFQTRSWAIVHFLRHAWRTFVTDGDL